MVLEGSRFYQVAVYDRQTSQWSLRGGLELPAKQLCAE
jgi:hypothetical protein